MCSLNQHYEGALALSISLRLVAGEDFMRVWSRAPVHIGLRERD
jgi:hypothetical protein